MPHNCFPCPLPRCRVTALTSLPLEPPFCLSLPPLPPLPPPAAALPDPLPPSARQQLHQLLTANYPNYFADLLPDATANTTAAATDSPRGSSTGPDQAQDPDYATYTARAAAAAAGEAAVAGGAAVPGRTGARGRGVRSRTAAALTANTTASSSSGSSLSTDSGTGGSTDDNGVPYMDVPSLVEAYDVLHRPRVEHLMPVRVRQPPESSAGAASTANRQPLPPLLTPYQVAGRVVAFHELFFSQMRMQQLRSRVRWVAVRLVACGSSFPLQRSGDEDIDNGPAVAGSRGARRKSVSSVGRPLRREAFLQGGGYAEDLGPRCAQVASHHLIARNVM